MTRQPPREPMDAAFALPLGFFGMLAIGAVAAGVGRADRAVVVLSLTCLLVAAVSATAAATAVLPMAGLGWFTVAGFSRAPVGDLRGAPLWSFAAVTCAAAAGLGVGGIARISGTLEDVEWSRWLSAGGARMRRLAVMSARRRVAGLLLAAVLLPVLTAVLTVARDHLAFVDELLFYLLTVVGVTLVGGFWPAVLAALASGLLVNWFFTPPLHTWTIEDPQNLLALLLFVTTAVSVSSVVHLAARRGELARDRTAEAEALLALARTVLGDDTPEAVLGHLADTLGLAAVLEERSGGSWVRIASGPARADAVDRGAATVVAAGPDFRLVVHGDASEVSPRLLEGFAAQAVSACERQRLRIQAEQSEALAAGNRMRTALLAAVSHDLRTPLASVKASVSSLRQHDVAWTEADRATLLATIEEGADRLGTLIGNLLDMSRIHTGAVQPFIRAVSLDEVLPAVAHGLDGGSQAVLDVPDDLPLINTDPVLLERALANLVSNALRFSPHGRPPRVVARCGPGSERVGIEVVDHGPGIPAGSRDRVFEPFQQLGDQRSTGGVGLGLAVAKGFVEAVGGRIDAGETAGGGLTMRVEIPVAAPELRRPGVVL